MHYGRRVWFRLVDVCKGNDTPRTLELELMVIPSRLIVKCPVEGCNYQLIHSAGIAKRGWLYLHLLNVHGWSIRRIEGYLNKEGI